MKRLWKAKAKTNITLCFVLGVKFRSELPQRQ